MANDIVRATMPPSVAASQLAGLRELVQAQRGRHALPGMNFSMPSTITRTR